jgi:hypothetical protein
MFLGEDSQYRIIVCEAEATKNQTFILSARASL